MEKVIMTKRTATRNHWFAMLLGVFLFLCPVTTIIGLFIFIGILVKKLSAKYTVTTERCICEYGLISKSRMEIYLEDIRGVALKQGIMQRLLGVGDVYIGSSATSGMEVVFKGVSSPSFVVQQINNYRRKNH